jgi:hypothetical protein
MESFVCRHWSIDTISTRCKDATLISAESSWIDPHRMGTERHNHLYLRLRVAILK